jgi:Tol biopolymer transport system component
VQQLTARPVDNPVLNPIISPDGNYLAYNDNDGISLQRIDTGEVRLLSGTKGFGMTDWFPDGASLAASLDHELWVVSSLTGAMRKIADNIGPAWISPDGARIAFFRPETWFGADAIWVMEADGGNQHVLATAQAGELFESFGWAPNGQRFVYQKDGLKSFAIETIDLHGGQPNVILSGARFIGDENVWWLPDGRIIYEGYAENPQEENNFWAVQVDSSGRVLGKPIQITKFAGYALSGISASKNGKRLAFTRQSFVSAIYVGELQENGTRLKEPQRLTMNNWFELPSGWTSDSESVLIASSRSGGPGGGWGILKQRLNERTAERLFAGAEEYPWATLSSDGRWLLFWAVSRGKDPFSARLMRLPVSGGNPEVVLTSNQLEASHQCALWRPNFCVLEEQDPGGNQRVFSAFEPTRGRTGEIKRMTGGFFAAYAWWSLSPDGTRIAVAQRKPTIRILDLKTGTEQNLTAKTEVAHIQKIAWSSDGRSLFASGFSGTGKGPGVLVNIDMQGNTHLLHQDSHTWVAFPAPSPDGKHLAFTKGKRAENNVAMMENF